MTFDHGQRMTLTFDTHSTSLTHLAECFKQLETQGCNSLQKKNNFHFFPYKSLCDQIWPWHKRGQSQPRVIIWTTLVVLAYMMLHTKFQGHGSIGSWEEDFLRFLPYKGIAAMLIMWPDFVYKCSFIFLKLSYEFCFQLAQPFLRKKQVLTLKSEWPLTKVKEWPWLLILTQLHKLI